MATNAIRGSIDFGFKTGPLSNERIGLTFNWEVIGQEGMDSIISWSLTSSYSLQIYDTHLSGNYFVSINGNELVKITSHSELYLYGTNDKAPRKTTIQSGTYRLQRSLETNTAAFNVICSAVGTSTLDRHGLIDGKPSEKIEETITWNHNISKSEDYIVYSTTKSGSEAQIVSISDFTDEAGPLITYSYDRGTSVSSAKIEVGVAFNGNNIVLPYREISTTETTYNFDFTEDDLESLYTLLHNGETATIRFYLKTTEVVGDETLVITSEPFLKTFTFINYKPLLKPTLTDLNDTTYALTGNRNHLVRYMSKVAYDMNVELRKGALDVIGCYIQNGGRIEEGFQSGTFENPTTNIFYFSATDDRGYTGTASKSLSLFDGEFIDYIKLSSSLKSTPISGEGNISITITGKYFNANFGVEQNKLIVQYAIYKKGTTPSWTEPTEVTPEMIDNETYTYTFSDGGLDYTAQYIVAVKVNDLLMSSESSISVVAKPVFYWNNDEFIFNVPVTFNEGFNGNLYEEGTVAGYYMNSSGSYTSGGYTWYYRKWNDGLLECWCTVPISTTVSTSWGSLYTASALYKTDLSYPIQLVGTPTVMVTLGAGNTKGMLMTDNSYAADNISTGRYNIVSATSVSSSATFRFNYYVKGRWK